MTCTLNKCIIRVQINKKGLKISNLKRTSISLDEYKFSLFKQVCKDNNSDASKEIRKFIERELIENENKVKEIIKRKNND